MFHNTFWFVIISLLKFLWFRVFLSNTNLYTWFKVTNPILIMSFVVTIIWFQVSLTYADNFQVIIWF